MSLRTHASARTFASLFLSFLVIQMSLVIPQTEWLCRCGDELPHTAACCCNCPKCVDERGGLISYCNISVDKGNRQGQFLESMGCACGLGRVALNLPGDAPYLPLGGIHGIILSRMYADPPNFDGILPYAIFSIFQPPG